MLILIAIAISNHCTTNIWIVSACRKRKTSRIQLQQRQQHDDDDDVSNAGSGFYGQSWNGRTFAVLAGKHAHPVLNARQRFGLRRRFRFQLHLQQQLSGHRSTTLSGLAFLLKKKRTSRRVTTSPTATKTSTPTPTSPVIDGSCSRGTSSGTSSIGRWRNCPDRSCRISLEEVDSFVVPIRTPSSSFRRIDNW